MKTLKKTLCLVLAVVMAVGVLVLPAYAADYSAAVETLVNYGILHGYDDHQPHPEGSITRAEMATIVYRVMTGDTTSTNAAVATKYGSYASKFSDAGTAEWAKGYIGFCANEGVLKGTPGGMVFPNEPITGYEVQAMLLRALGYDKNNEYTGANWTYNVLSDATKTGISKNVPEDPAKVALRGAVSQLTVNAATGTDCVEPALYPSVGYKSLGKKLMEIGATGEDYDDWGAPITVYNVKFAWADTPVEKVVPIADEPLLESFVPVTQASVYAAMKLNPTSATSVATYTNGKDNTANISVSNTQTALDAANAIGAQGRWTRVYADRIVYVDTFLAEVTDVTDEVKVNGQTAVAASYTMTAFYNNANAAIATAGYEGDVTGATTTFAAGDMLSTNAYATASPFSADSQIKAFANTGKAATASVTVRAIVKETNGTSITGLVANNGKTYLYNVTYAYNGGKSDDAARLDDEAIGKSYTLYLDGQGNILGVEPVAESGSRGTGVVTDFGAFRIGAKQYAAQLTVLTKDNTSVTVRFLNPTGYVVYTSEDDAEDAAEDYYGDLISWDPETTSTVKGYSAITEATETSSFEIANTVEAGDADAISDTLVDDKTVFFIANYQMKNSAGGFVFTGYSIVTGFQNIQDLTFGGTIVEAGNPYSTLTSLQAQYIGSSYVLVINATNKSTNTVETVSNYAYLANPVSFVEVNDDYYQYKAIINGTANQPLRVNYNGVDDIDATGLYTYSEYTNDGWKNVTKSENLINGGTANYTYKNGVLKVLQDTPNGVQASATPYLTVAKDVAIYIVSPTTGTSVKVNVPLDTVEKAYGDASNRVWFQLNQYGWINVIYVEGEVAAAPGTAPASGTLTVADVTLDSGATGNKITISDGTITGTDAWTTAKCSISANVKIWNGLEYVAYTTGTAADVTLVGGTATLSGDITTTLPLGPGNYVVEISITGTGTGNAKKTVDTITLVLYVPAN